MAQPSTRDLGSVIDACRIVEDELTFHATRLDTIGRPTREGEASHHAELASDYKRAARAVGVLRRYQEGRIVREQGRADAIDARGTAQPYVDG